MDSSKVKLAVLNNVHWYEAMFAAHGLACETDQRVWRSNETPPPFHSNLVVLSPLTTVLDIEAYAGQIERQPRPAGWSLKDSYACLDLAALGFSVLFQADWTWREPVRSSTPLPSSRLAWKRLVSPASLVDWERAWSGDSRNEAQASRTPQFPVGLLGDPDYAFFAGRFRGEVVAGGIANRSPGAVGLSNLFSPREHLQETWRALTSHIAAAFPDTPIVGYERGDDLNFALNAGFACIGKLRVWCRPA